MVLLSSSHPVGEVPGRTAKLGRARIRGIVPAVLGLVLLAAAALKAYQLATAPVVENGLFTSRWFLIGLIEFELALGLVLALGLYPRAAGRVALACFAGFGAVSLHQALAGKASCGCLGKIDLRPGYTFLFDLSAVAALWRWNSGAVNGCADRGGVRRVPSSLLLLTIFGILFSSLGIPAAVAGIRGPRAFLTMSPERIDLGEVRAGGRAEGRFALANPGVGPVEVSKIECSCPCMTASLSAPVVAPQGEVSGRITLDLGAEPAFAGELAVEVRGLDAAGRLLFLGVVEAKVSRGLGRRP